MRLLTARTADLLHHIMHSSVLNVEGNLQGSVNIAVRKLRGVCKTSAKDAEEDSMRHLLRRNTAPIAGRLYPTARHIALAAEEDS